jgi:adenosylhomocysteine nucleosidase
VAALDLEIPRGLWGNRSEIIYSGVGKINAAMSLCEAFQIHHPDLVINLGSAGSLSTSLEGVVEVSSVLERDMDAFPICDRGVIPFERDGNIHTSGYEGVICASGDSFVRKSDSYLNSMKVDIVDMELIAIARVCKKFNVPWRSFKFISDYIGRNSGDEWRSGVKDASKGLINKFDLEFR